MVYCALFVLWAEGTKSGIDLISRDLRVIEPRIVAQDISAVAPAAFSELDGSCPNISPLSCGKRCVLSVR